MDIIKIIKSLLRQYKIIIGSSVLMAGLVFLFTLNISRKYTSTATIYTGIATGTTIISMDGRSDWSAQSSSFDNLANIFTSRETLQEVGLRLLASHLVLQQADPKYISIEHFSAINEWIPSDVRGLVGETEEETYHNLMVNADANISLTGIINYPHIPYYSIGALSSISVNRKGNSDMISLNYTSDDPGVCQQTLKILIDVCVRNYRRIKEGQTDKVVDFYEEQLQLAQANLKNAEAKEQKFKEKYNLVNYSTQQDIVITDQKEIMDQINKEKEALSATEAGIRNIESQLGAQAQSLKNTIFLEKRDRLSRLSGRLNTAEFNNASPETIADLQTQITQVKTDMNQDITTFSASPAGKTNEAAANEYFNKVITYEEGKARLKVLENRKNATMAQYNRFLPLGDTLKKIQREIDISEKAYLAVLNSLNQSKKQQQDQRSFSTIQVIDTPNYPLTAKSTRKILILLGGMIGGIIPVTVILAMMYFNNDMKTPQRTEQITGLKVGGIIPDTKKLNTYKNPEQVGDGLSDTILKNLYMSDHKNQQQRILIISTRPSEGKTVISNMLCDRLIRKGRKCLVVVPYLDSGSWSVVSYKVDNAFYQARAEDLVPVERLNNADILILELPPLIMSDYPVSLIKEFDMAFLVCNANREWTKADQTALDSFIKISGIKPQVILNEVDVDVVEEVLGKIS